MQRYPRGECPVCHLSYRISKAGRLGCHNGVTAAGFSSGERCAGTGEVASVVYPAPINGPITPPF